MGYAAIYAAGVILTLTILIALGAKDVRSSPRQNALDIIVASAAWPFVWLVAGVSALREIRERGAEG